MLTAGDSSRAGTGNMCVRIADIEAVDKPLLTVALAAAATGKHADEAVFTMPSGTVSAVQLAARRLPACAHPGRS